MSIEEIQKEDLYIPFGNRKYHKKPELFGKFEEKIYPPHEANFAMNDLMLAERLTSNDLWLILSGVCTETQILQNNWRRLHNIPMKKERRK